MACGSIGRAVTVALAIVAGPTSGFAQAGAVRGTVEDTEGRAIKGATITANNPVGRPTTLTATSDAKGRFAIIGLVGGLWAFVAEAPGYIPQQGATRIRQVTTGNPPVQFVLTKATVQPPGVLTKQVQADIAAADELRSSGRLDQAIAAYQEIAAKNPALTAIQIVVGDAYRQRAAQETTGPARAALYDRALASYQEALKADASNERARIEMAMTWVQKGSFEEAERTLAGGADQLDASRDILFSLAEVRFAKGDMAGAQALFERVSKLDAQWLRPVLKLGLIAFRQGNRERAASLFQRVVSGGPSSPEATEASAYLKELSK